MSPYARGPFTVDWEDRVDFDRVDFDRVDFDRLRRDRRCDLLD